MAITDRDWYRESFRRGGGSGGGSNSTTHGGGGGTGGSFPTAANSGPRRRAKVKQWRRRGYAAIAVPLLLAVGWQYRAQVDATASDWILKIDATVRDWKTDDPVVLPPATPVIAAPIAPIENASTQKVIRLGNRPALDVPATRVTEWFVDHPRLGRVSVHVPVGTTPREALTIALAERGYQAIR